jgi:phytoene dehydrogenase-like protein
MQKFLRPKGKVPNIAIVGAGVSGLRCADVLIKSGARVTIYEARDRIGGRVYDDVAL